VSTEIEKEEEEATTPEQEPAPEAATPLAEATAAGPESAAAPDAHAGWGVPLPAEIPRPTYLPAVMAFGLTFFLWGFVSSPVVLGIGLLVTVVALVGWIGEMQHGD
jgi:hypothetical protein